HREGRRPGARARAAGGPPLRAGAGGRGPRARRGRPRVRGARGSRDRERARPRRADAARQPPGTRPAAAGAARAPAAAGPGRRGQHWRQAADSRERAPSATQRELRAHTLGTTFRALANAGGGVLADRVAQFAIAAREAVASGLAVNNPAGFAAELRRVGDLLARSSAGDEEAMAAELDGLIAGVRALQPGAPPPVVPIESLAPAPAPPSRPRAPGAAEEAVPESADLVGSWAVYQRLVMGGVGPASLEELMAAAAQVPTRPRAP